MTILSGKARVAGIIGWPVEHSRSPRLHGFWLERHGIDGAYVPLPIRPEAFALAVRGLAAAGFAGANVTAPHKLAAFEICDTVEASARRAGAVNTLVFQDGRITGRNTDGLGFVANLRAHGVDPAAGPALVLGAGGAARAVIYALKSRGFKRIAVVNRTRGRAEALAAHFGGPAEAASWGDLRAELREADLLVNTSLLGMAGQPPLAVDLSPLPDRAVVADIIYVPLRTPLIEAARARRLRAAEGLGMLLHQAAPGFARWFGVRPTVTPALRALVEAEVLATQVEAQ